MGIAIVGVGAIGATVAAALTRAGRHDVSLYGRDHRSGVGLRIRVDVGDTSIIVEDAEAPSRAPHRWILLATKAHQTLGAAALLAELTDERTIVAVLQNGIDHVERVAPLVPRAQVLPVIVEGSAERVAIDHVVTRGTMRLTVPDVAAAPAFAALFAESFVTVDVRVDFDRVCWQKLCVNAIGGISVLTGAPLDLRKSDLAELARDMLREIVTVARACGVALDDAIVDDLVRRYRETPATRPNSILADKLAGRPLEHEVRNGVIVRLADRHGIDVPVNRAVVAQLCAASAVSEGVPAAEAR